MESIPSASTQLSKYTTRELPHERLDELWPGVVKGVARRRLRARLVPAAVAAAAAAGLFLVLRPGGPPVGTLEGDTLATGRQGGQARTLLDGSRIELGPSTQLRVIAARRDAVRLALVRGTVDVAVSHAPGRRFTVQAEAYEVIARGTRFRVELPDSFEPELGVTVREGEVEVRGVGGNALAAIVRAGESWSALLEGSRRLRAVEPSGPAPSPKEEPSPAEPEPSVQQEAALRAEPDAAGGEDFLGRKGRQLMLGGKPFRYLGYTAFTLTGCGIGSQVPTPAEMDAFFASLRPRSVVRTLAFASQGMVAIESVAERARRHGVKLVLVLTDHQGYCGEGEPKTAEWYADGYRESFLPWVRLIAERLKDSPAVGMWEVVKAPHGIDAKILRAFYDAVGGELHRIAPRHLVESGTHGPWAYGGEEGYRLIHESPGIDVASYHDYNQSLGPSQSHVDAARVLATVDKPLVVGELAYFAGRAADPGRQFYGRPCVSWGTRADALGTKLKAIFATELAGATLWSWMPATKNKTSCRLETFPEDPLTALVRDFPLP